MEKIAGSIERVTYYNPDNGYSVLKIKPDMPVKAENKNRGVVTVVGNLPELQPGEFIHASGKWIEHSKHGNQFQVESLEQAIPITLWGIRKYLGSGLIKGVGDKTAEKIVELFGENTLEIIENHPERLLEVNNLGEKRAKEITNSWIEQKTIKEIMIYLHGFGITTNMSLKIYKEYGDESINILKSNPYTLSDDIHGIGFKSADKIAVSIGLPSDHPYRIEAGIIYSLENMASDGHSFVPMEEMKGKVSELLVVNQDLVDTSIEQLLGDKKVVVEELVNEETIKAVYLPQYYYAEVNSAKKLIGLGDSSQTKNSASQLAFDHITGQLSKEQEIAIRTALSEPVSVITGGPGTGKTTCIRSLIDLAGSAGRKYALVSPTGRASKRLSEATGKPASTIHRLLGFGRDGKFKHNEDNPIPFDLLVVDEVSMMDIQLSYSLLKALKPGTSIVLVGDVDQLPPVGAGNFLRDVIDSEVFPLTKLSKIFRQDKDSHIISNAHLINQGEMPVFDKDSQDFFMFRADSPIQAADWVLDLVTNRMPRKFGVKPEEIQVLAPMYRGDAGIHELNSKIQDAVNPGNILKPERKSGNNSFRVGDKVLQLRNNYDKKVFNGDIGIIKDILSTEKEVIIEYDGRDVSYVWNEMDEITLAYAISIHKSQGSEFPIIIVVLLPQHYLMLQRNLVYTAVTRAKEACVLVSNYKALGISVRNNKIKYRYSWLAERIRLGSKE
jgi:exodeoxyribonuclease V alpha subunit